MGLGNLPGISNGDNSPVSAPNTQKLSSTASSQGTSGSQGATFTFGAKASPLPVNAIVIGVVVLGAILGVAYLRKGK